MNRFKLYIIGAIVVFVGILLGAVYALTYNYDKIHFAEDLIPYTDVSHPEMNKAIVEYDGETYELIGWDVANLYRVINRGDSSRKKLLFHKNYDTKKMKITFEGAATIICQPTSYKEFEDKVYIKYVNEINHTTHYYEIEGLRMFPSLLEIIQPEEVDDSED